MIFAAVNSFFKFCPKFVAMLYRFFYMPAVVCVFWLFCCSLLKQINRSKVFYHILCFILVNLLPMRFCNLNMNYIPCWTAYGCLLHYLSFLVYYYIGF